MLIAPQNLCLFLALLAYNGTIARYEENQLFLDDINAIEKQLERRGNAAGL